MEFELHASNSINVSLKKKKSQIGRKFPSGLFGDHKGFSL